MIDTTHPLRDTRLGPSRLPTSTEDWLQFWDWWAARIKEFDVELLVNILHDVSQELKQRLG